MTCIEGGPSRPHQGLELPQPVCGPLISPPLMHAQKAGTHGLIWASYNGGHLQMVKALLAAGADKEIRDPVSVGGDAPVTRWV